MDSRLYEDKLAKHKIFKDLKDSLKENPSGKLRNLLHLSDDVLYVWSAIENCLPSLNLKKLEQSQEEVPYQKLTLVNPPQYPVERLMISPCGNKICVWGSRGVTIVDLPSRWGRGGLFESGKSEVLCMSTCLDERFMFSQYEIRRVHWHPASTAHVFVLVSDNTLRVYYTLTKKAPRLIKTLKTGQKPTLQPQLAGRTILDSLGDTAVDFSIISHMKSALILRGNGDVYMISCDFDELNGPTEPKLQGPLVMYPPADDNYGTESCSIAVLDSGATPPVVVVATCSAALYHCVLLPNSYKQDSDGYALYVVETVELSLGLGMNGADIKHSYPVHLYPYSKNSYLCVHVGGVHTVSLPLVEQLTNYAYANDELMEEMLSSLCGEWSRAQYLVCTGVPPAGGAVTAPPLPVLLLLCDDNALITRTLEPLDLEELFFHIHINSPTSNQEEINQLLKKKQSLHFTETIKEVLKRETSQPILKINKKEEPSPKEMLEVCTQAVGTLRAEYLQRQQLALDAVARKVAALVSLTNNQNGWCRRLQKDIDEVRVMSKVLVEKCSLAEKHEDDLKYRCSALIRGVRGASSISGCERELLSQLQLYARRGDSLREQLHALKELKQKKCGELTKWQQEYKKKQLALGKSHSDTISSVLQQQTSQISSLIEDTKILKDKLSLV